MIRIKGKTYETIFDSANLHKVCIKQLDEQINIVKRRSQIVKELSGKDKNGKTYNEIIKKLEAYKKPHEEALNELVNIIKARKETRADNLEKVILYAHWIDGERLEDIAERLGYSFDHINRLHANIIKDYLIDR